MELHVVKDDKWLPVIPTVMPVPPASRPLFPGDRSLPGPVPFLPPFPFGHAAPRFPPPERLPYPIIPSVMPPPPPPYPPPPGYRNGHYHRPNFHNSPPVRFPPPRPYAQPPSSAASGMADRWRPGPPGVGAQDRGDTMGAHGPYLRPLNVATPPVTSADSPDGLSSPRSAFAQLGSLYVEYSPPLGITYSSLHYDIMRLIPSLTPTAAELARKQDAYASLRAAALELWPMARVSIFGSAATALDHPGSDVDIAVIGSLPEGMSNQLVGDRYARQSTKAKLARQVHKMADHVLHKGLVREMQRIARARIPVIKLVHVNGTLCDVAFEGDNGPKAVPFLREQVRKYPPLRPLILILKRFLGDRGLNKVFEGGLGSYCLINMIISHLQLSREKHDLGYLLVGFLQRYAHDHDYRNQAVSIREGGVASKRKLGWMNDKRPESLAVQDPQALTADVGKAVHNIEAIRKAFAESLKRLSQARQGPHAGCLALVVNVEAASQRVRPDQICLRSEGDRSSGGGGIGWKRKRASLDSKGDGGEQGGGQAKLKGIAGNGGKPDETYGDDEEQEKAGGGLTRNQKRKRKRERGRGGASGDTDGGRPSGKGLPKKPKIVSFLVEGDDGKFSVAQGPAPPSPKKGGLAWTPSMGEGRGKSGKKRKQMLTRKKSSASSSLAPGSPSSPHHLTDTLVPGKRGKQKVRGGGAKPGRQGGVVKKKRWSAAEKRSKRHERGLPTPRKRSGSSCKRGQGEKW